MNVTILPTPVGQLEALGASASPRVVAWVIVGVMAVGVFLFVALIARYEQRGYERWYAEQLREQDERAKRARVL